MLVDGPVEVAPLTPHLDVGLVDPDRSAMRLTELAEPLLHQRRVGEHPAVQGAVIHLQPALQEQLLDIAVAQRVTQVPGDGLNDQRRLVVPPLEVALGALLELGGDGGQDHGAASRMEGAMQAVWSTSGKRQRYRVCDTPPRTAQRPDGARRPRTRPSRRARADPMTTATPSILLSRGPKGIRSRLVREPQPTHSGRQQL